MLQSARVAVLCAGMLAARSALADPGAASSGEHQPPPLIVRHGPTVECHTVIECVVNADGTLRDCVLLKEDPPGYGFGRAALDAARYFRMKPATQDGKPVAGGRVRIPMDWKPTPGSATSSQPPSAPAPH